VIRNTFHAEQWRAILTILGDDHKLRRKIASSLRYKANTDVVDVYLTTSETDAVETAFEQFVGK
jgi:methylmalonyl-CoA mutase cobalamin-binding subunit